MNCGTTEWERRWVYRWQTAKDVAGALALFLVLPALLVATVWLFVGGK